MDPEDPDKSAQLRQSLDRAYDLDTEERVDDRMIAMMLQLSSDDLPHARAIDPLDRPGLAARLLRSLRLR